MVRLTLLATLLFAATAQAQNAQERCEAARERGRELQEESMRHRRTDKNGSRRDGCLGSWQDTWVDMCLHFTVDLPAWDLACMQAAPTCEEWRWCRLPADERKRTREKEERGKRARGRQR